VHLAAQRQEQHVTTDVQAESVTLQATERSDSQDMSLVPMSRIAWREMDAWSSIQAEAAARRQAVSSSTVTVPMTVLGKNV
jgi:hypothetical protein